MSLNPNEVLIAPVVSEKSYAEIENGKYSFRVHQDAHKTQVRQAVEQAFDVKVAAVNIVQVRSKPKRRGLIKGTRPGWKKAVVKLSPARRSRSSRGQNLMPVRKFKPTVPAGGSCRCRPSRRSRRRRRRRACSSR